MIHRDKYNGGCPGLGVSGEFSYYLMDTKIQFYKMKTVLVMTVVQQYECT